MSDTAKRKHDDTEPTVKTEDAPRKKRRWDTSDETKSTPTPTPTISSALTTPGVIPSNPGIAAALEKAKAAALLQRQIQEKLASLGKTTSIPSTTAKPNQPPPPPPPPLRVGFTSNNPLQTLGLNIPMKAVKQAPEWKPLVLDATGKAIGETPDVKRLATLKVNQRVDEPVKEEPQPEVPQHDPTKFIDPNISVHLNQRAPRTFHFTTPGKHVRKAQAFRAKLLDKQIRADSIQQQTLASQQIAVVEIIKPIQHVHQLEWWDQPLIKGNEEDGYDGELNIEKITHYIYHPVELKPVAEAPPPPPPAMKLTRAEQKKIKRRKRQDELKEKQEKIRLGLEKPDETKLTVRNFMAALGSEAILDPSAAEAKARKQVAARKAQHEKDNASRKLTKEQKMEKRKRKFTEDTSVETHVAVFRSGDLSDKQRRFKVDVNVQQWNLKGTALLHPEFHVVVVEGGPKSIKRFTNLMLHRINWEKSATNKTNDEENEMANGKTADDMSDDEMMDITRDFGPAKLVWSGTVATSQAAFKDFTFTRPRTEALARQYLREKHVEHYWDYARNYREQTE